MLMEKLLNKIMRLFTNQIKYFIVSILLAAWSFWLPVVLDHYDLIPFSMEWHEWYMCIVCFHWCNCWVMDSFFAVLFYLISIKPK